MKSTCLEFVERDHSTALGIHPLLIQVSDHSNQDVVSSWNGRSFSTCSLTGVMTMSLGTILLVVLILILLGVIPTWRHSRGWGYAPSGVIGVILVIVLILFLLGRI